MKDGVIAIALLTVSTFCFEANSQSDDNNALAFLVGDWDVAEYIAPGVMGPEREGQGKAAIAWGPGNNSVIINYESVSGPMSGFQITQFVSKDQADNAFELAWVDSFTPGVTLRQGMLRDDGSFRFTSVAEINGANVTQISLISRTDSGFMIETFNEMEDYDPALSMRLTYTPAQSSN